MAAEQFEIILFLPMEMWGAAYNNLNLENSVQVEVRDLPVQKTGAAGSAFAEIRTAGKAGAVPIMALPLAHCAHHIQSENLIVLGPAFRTRNDIFIFRRREPPVGKPRHSISVGVLEAELTTSYILYITMHYWYPDICLGSILDNYKDIRKSREQFRDDFGPVLVPRAELKSANRSSLLSERVIDAALFVGAELDDRSLLANDTILDAINLNQVINNLYGVKMFPRAVLAVFSEDWKAKREPIEKFLDAFNQAAGQKARGAGVPGLLRTQAPCLTGNRTDDGEAGAMIRFTHDMCEDVIQREVAKGVRAGYSEPRPFVHSDFQYWRSIWRVQLQQNVIGAIRGAKITDLFSLTTQQSKPSSILNSARENICSGLTALGAFPTSCDEIHAVVRKAPQLTGDDKETMNSFVSDWWANHAAASLA